MHKILLYEVGTEKRQSLNFSRQTLTKVFIFQRTINVWNTLSTDCVNSSSINMFKNMIDKYLVKAGYTYNMGRLHVE